MTEKNANPEMPMGYSPVPAGKLANVVTFLEMREKPAEKAITAPSSFALRRLSSDDQAEYLRLFRLVGEDWMWVSALTMCSEKVDATLSNPATEIYAMNDGTENVGLMQLDFSVANECEVVFFGLAASAIGQGVGRFMMNQTIARAFARPIHRLWLHTCTFDHPGANMFYQRSGFRPYKFMVEVHDDPRLSGIFPKTAAPHVPLIEPAAWQ